MNQKIKILLFLGLSVFLFQSCDRNRYYEENTEVSDNKWFYQDAKEFKVSVNDTLSLYNFYLNIRNTNEYPYANLYVFVETTFPNSEMANDTIELQLADLKGKWLGSGKGKYKYNNFILREAMKFGSSGDYIFKIRQGMRVDTLEGISDVGIRLEYYQK